MGDYIYIIGCLGYYEARICGETPVYRLDCQTFAIEKIITAGNKPGWIDSHKAYYREPAQIFITGGKVTIASEDKIIRIENRSSYILDLNDLNWCRVDS